MARPPKKTHIVDSNVTFRKTEEYNQALHLLNNMTKDKMNRVLERPRLK